MISVNFVKREVIWFFLIGIAFPTRETRYFPSKKQKYKAKITKNTEITKLPMLLTRFVPKDKILLLYSRRRERSFPEIDERSISRKLNPNFSVISDSFEKKADSLKKFGLSTKNFSASTRKDISCFESIKINNPKKKMIISIVPTENPPAKRRLLNW